eukprot:Seg1561.1 transcript_id=Seg1561.1/GoldUCD/mRNA.D3Y31 product="Neurogenic locus notch protein 1" protein_id=Seg1561.1/GoldUCD/D3Y31
MKALTTIVTFCDAVNIATCRDINCFNGGTCIVKDGYPTCECKAGFEGSNCEADMNECHTGTQNCHVNAMCINTEGSFKCTCKFGYYGDGFSCSVRNLALGKPASQSSTFSFTYLAQVNFAAYRGNDGDRFTSTWTQIEVNPWWQVDLGGSAHILRVVLMHTHVASFSAIHVGDDNSGGGINNAPCVASVMSTSLLFNEFVCPIGMKGRYVSVHVNGNSMLSMFEIEVYAV